jgi:hypothetical protein
MKEDIISFESQIDPAYNVSVVYREYERYDELVDIMGKFGDTIALLSLNTNHIFVDGEKLTDLNFDHLLAIQAHEICHSVLKHSPGISEVEEIEADLAAISLLTEIGYYKAADLLAERLQNVRCIDYSLETFKETLSQGKLDLYEEYLKLLSK